MSSPNTLTDKPAAAQPIAIDTARAGRPRSNSLWSNPGLSPSSSPLSTTMSALQTPTSFTASSTFPRPAVQNSPPSATSPLAFFLPSSPVKKPSVFPWNNPPSMPATSPKGLTRVLTNESALVEDDDSDPSPLLRNNTTSGTSHFRTGSLNWSHNPAGRDRAAGVMRRLSLSGALGGRPNVSPPDRSRVPSPPMPTPVSQPQSGSYSPPQPTHHQQATAPASTEAFTSAAQQANKPRSGTPNGVRRGRARGPSDPSAGLKKRGVSPMGERMLKGHFDGFGL